MNYNVKFLETEICHWDWLGTLEEALQVLSREMRKKYLS